MDENASRVLPRRSQSPLIEQESLEKMVETELKFNFKQIDNCNDIKLLKEISKAYLTEKAVEKYQLQMKYETVRDLNRDLKNTAEALEKQNYKLQSIIVIRGDFEGVEEEMALSFGFPEKTIMIQELKTAKKWACNFRKMNESIHFVKWLYYITFSTDKLAMSINTLLIEHKVQPITFCIFVAKIYMKTSHLIHVHKPNNEISSQDMLNGLKMYGIDDSASLETIKIMMKIKTLPLSRIQSTVSTPASTLSKELKNFSTSALSDASTPFKQLKNRNNNLQSNRGY